MAECAMENRSFEQEGNEQLRACGTRTNLKAHGLGVEAVEVGKAFFLFGAVAAASVGLRLEIFVDDFADVAVFDLDFVAELHGLLSLREAIGGKVPLENRDAGFG